MKTERLYELIDDIMKQKGYDEYEINSMKIENCDYKINSDGELIHDKQINVVVYHKKELNQINITISPTNSKKNNDGHK